jgi:hypothetical protein
MQSFALTLATQRARNFWRGDKGLILNFSPNFHAQNVRRPKEDDFFFFFFFPKRNTVLCGSQAPSGGAAFVRRAVDGKQGRVHSQLPHEHPEHAGAV